MKIIFLDFDGVLNYSPYVEKMGDDFKNNYLCPECLKRVAKIVEKTGAKIVLSTTWRKDLDDDMTPNCPVGRRTEELFASVGLKLYSKTPDISLYRRELEVQAWLDAHPDVESYVMLDDVEYFREEPLLSHFVRTNNETGLTDEHVEKAIEILGTN